MVATSHLIAVPQACQQLEARFACTLQITVKEPALHLVPPTANRMPRPQAVAGLADVQNRVAQLAQARQRLGTDVGYFRSQGSQLARAADWLKTTASRRRQLGEILVHEPMVLLTQLVQVAAACMQQVAAQLSDHAAPTEVVVDTCRTAAMFHDAMELGQQYVITQIPTRNDEASTNIKLLVVAKLIGTLDSTGWQMNAGGTEKHTRMITSITEGLCATVQLAKHDLLNLLLYHHSPESIREDMPM